MDTKETTNTDVTSQQSTNTSGSIRQQFANSAALITTRRKAAVGGGEAISLALVRMEVWEGVDEATIQLAKEVVKQQLDPGSEDLVARTKSLIEATVCCSRAAIRDQLVRPLGEKTLRDCDELRVRAMARITTDNATSFTESLTREWFSRFKLLEAVFQARIEACFGPERLLQELARTARESTEGIGVFLAAAERLRREMADDVDLLRHDIQEASERATTERQTLMVVAVEVSQSSWFSRRKKLPQFFQVLTTTVSRLGASTLLSMYGPLVLAGYPAALSAMDHFIAELRERRKAMLRADDGLAAAEAELGERDRLSARIRMVGAPGTDAARSAAIEKMVKRARDAAGRRLRDLCVWESPTATLLQALQDGSQWAVVDQAPKRSLDDVLLSGNAPEAVALEIDHFLAKAVLPVAITANANRRFLQSVSCSVLRTAEGSELPALLERYAKRPRDRFNRSGTRERLELLLFQPGIDLEATSLFEGGVPPYEDEIADVASPRVHVLSDAALKRLSRAEGEPDAAKDAELDP